MRRWQFFDYAMAAWLLFVASVTVLCLIARLWPPAAVGVVVLFCNGYLMVRDLTDP